MTDSSSKIRVAENDADLDRCWEVMRELRSHLRDAADFRARVYRQQKEGYRVALLVTDDIARAVAGYRVVEMLFSGRHLYVDDLVTREEDRSQGFGAALFDWLVEEARAQGCATLELDSGVQRFDAHRFYFVKRMKIASYHFSLPLSPKRSP